MNDSMRIVGIAGSLRKASVNRAALRAAVKLVPQWQYTGYIRLGMNSAIQCGPGTSLSASAKELKATKETHQPVEKIKNKAMAVLILKWLLDLKDISALASDAKLISVQMFPIDQDMQQPS